MIGKVIGNWVILKKLGRGGMGTVFLARHNRLDKQAAVKMLSSSYSQDPVLQERFTQEARTQAKLRHANIANVLDCIEQDGTLYMIIEYIEGQTLEEILYTTRVPIPIPKILKWMKQVLSALDFAHRMQIVHRDLKPSNIMIDRNGDAKVTDFGIALAVGEKRLTSTGMAMGTAQYMSPEQIIRPRDIDFRADIYSMGVVLFELLTGHIPFEGDSDYAIHAQHINVPPPSPRALNPSVPAALESIVLKALEKNPVHRFASCEEFAQALSGYEQMQQRKGTQGLQPVPGRGRELPPTRPVFQPMPPTQPAPVVVPSLQNWPQSPTLQTMAEVEERSEIQDRIPFFLSITVAGMITLGWIGGVVEKTVESGRIDFFHWLRGDDCALATMGVIGLTFFLESCLVFWLYKKSKTWIPFSIGLSLIMSLSVMIFLYSGYQAGTTAALVAGPLTLLAAYIGIGWGYLVKR